MVKPFWKGKHGVILFLPAPAPSSNSIPNWERALLHIFNQQYYLPHHHQASEKCSVQFTFSNREIQEAGPREKILHIILLSSQLVVNIRHGFAFTIYD